MHSTAIILQAPRSMVTDEVRITDPGPDDLVVDVCYSGISTGTEKLFWSGQMPPFPGMGYPLIPGYEALGEVVEAGANTGFKPGDTVFVPGADCYEGARGLFGGAASRLVTAADRVARIDPAMEADGALLALAATARHALATAGGCAPDLIVGHGVLGRLLARLAIAAGGPVPTVWEVDPERSHGAVGYSVIHPDADTRKDYACIIDASGQASLLDTLIARLKKGGELVLAGFYPEPLQFAFPPAFMREARLRVVAEWTPEDLTATRDLIEHGRLSLSGLITHEVTPSAPEDSYRMAFEDPTCLKMILNWEGVQ